MLIAISMLAIIVSVAVVPAATYYRQRAVQGAADRFLSAHTLARSAAMQHGRLAEFHLDEANGRLWIEVDTGAVGGARDTIGFVREIGDVTMSITGSISLLCFDPRGLPSTGTTTLGQNCEGPAGKVIFSLGARIDTVTVTALGKVLR
jgi:Tfp pilus assembly protein FimT